MSAPSKSPSSQSSLRSTQRAPKTCQPCASRKIKCDKQIPCSACVRRGQAASCSRETVVVRGEVVTWKESSVVVDKEAFDELLHENERLRQLVAQLQKRDLASPPHKVTTPRRIPDDKSYTEHLAAIQEVATAEKLSPSRRMGWNDIILPPDECSAKLIDYDRDWNSWVHYAIEYPTFDNEHRAFRQALRSGQSLQEFDPAWLAIYFSIITAALLTMDTEEANKLGLPSGKHDYILRNWYETSLFCLNESDFMRRWDIRSVQAIAVLGISFVNFSDSQLYVTMWTCALRIAQKLDLDRSPPERPRQETGGLSEESIRRLWWTLMICEWFALPYHTPLATEIDFVVPLPTVDQEGSLPNLHGRAPIHPVQYHIFMSRTALVWSRFQAAIHRTGEPLEHIVRRADEELAEVIDTLPPHLQPENQDDGDQLAIMYPWVGWQRFDVTLVLLHHRLRIHRTLRSEWLARPGQFGWAKSVCLSTARDLIWIASNWSLPAAKRRQWAPSMHLFTAAYVIIEEVLRPGDLGAEDREEWKSAIDRCVTYWDEVSSHNAMAARAADVLRHIMGTLHWN